MSHKDMNIDHLDLYLQDQEQEYYYYLQKLQWEDQFNKELNEDISIHTRTKDMETREKSN